MLRKVDAAAAAGCAVAVASCAGCILLYTRRMCSTAAASAASGRELPAGFLAESPVPPALHAEFTSMLAADPAVLSVLLAQHGAAASNGVLPGAVQKLPIDAFVSAVYGASTARPDGEVACGREARAGPGPSPSVRLIDVRSPAEYAHGHLPGAVNLPLFDNEQRAEVGTLYAEAGKERAIRQGLSLVGPKLCEMIRKTTGGGDEDCPSRVLVYCWRGGMRSQSVAWLLGRCGVAGGAANVSTLDGGYRAFRQWCTGLVGRDSPMAKEAAGVRARALLQPGDTHTVGAGGDGGRGEGAVATPAAAPPAVADIKACAAAYGAGTRCFKAGEYRVATQHYTVALAHAPSDWTGLGGCYNLRGKSSHGPWSHLDAPYYISLVIIHTNYSRARLNDSTADG
jgi:rhodanese-related sulfurtransferase